MEFLELIQLLENNKPLNSSLLGSNINFYFEYKGFFVTPLILSVKLNRIIQTKFLLDLNADISLKDKLIDKNDIQYGAEGLGCIHYASINGNMKMIKLLLSYHADINEESQEFKTPFLYSLQSNNLEVIKYISKKTFNVHKIVNFNNAISFALMYFASDEIIKYLIKIGIDINIVTPGNWTPLLGSIASERYKTAEILIKNGANLEAKTEGGWGLEYLCKNKLWLTKILQQKSIYQQVK